LRQFSPPHLAALAVLVLAGGVGVWSARRHPGRWVKPAALAVAGLVLAAWSGEYIADAILGIWSVKYDLPLQLTDAVWLVTVAALVSLARGTPRQRLVELVYFWSLSASLQAIVTPDLAYSFPSVFYFTYFGYHIGAVLAALVLVFGLRMYPAKGAVARVYAATLAWAALAATGCLLTGGNYMYLRHKPVHGSLLNAMGPWPWYIASTGALGLAMLLALAAIARAVGRLDRARTLPRGVPA
jgi:hypothetical integral membrane protein (TIGR02206 family)